MNYRLDVDREVYQLIRHLPPLRKRKLKESLRHIAGNPYSGKPLQEELAGLCSYRIGSLRVIYSIDKTRRTVHVVAIGPRETIYREVEREVQGILEYRS